MHYFLPVLERGIPPGLNLNHNAYSISPRIHVRRESMARGTKVLFNFARALRRISSHSWNHSQTIFSIEIGAKTMAAIITWLISFEKIWLRVVSAMTGNPPLSLVSIKPIGSLSKLTRRPRGGGQQANFYSKGLKAKWIQSALDTIHSLIEWRFECDHLLSAAASVCLSSLITTTTTTNFESKQSD